LVKIGNLVKKIPKIQKQPKKCEKKSSGGVTQRLSLKHFGQRIQCYFFSVSWSKTDCRGRDGTEDFYPFLGSRGPITPFLRSPTPLIVKNTSKIPQIFGPSSVPKPYFFGPQVLGPTKDRKK